MMKFQLYVLISVSLAVAVIGRAFLLRPNFWSASILLAQSNGSLILLTNVALITTGGFVWLLQRLLYGPLRPIEVEQLYEKGWMAVTETLLSLTIFREDIGTRFFVMFLSLMAGKVWEWIGEGRVEFLEQQPPANPLLFHSRLLASLTLSVFFDCFMLGYCLRVILRQARPGMMVMYGFEFTILSIQSISLLMKYFLLLAEHAIVKRQTAQRIEERRLELRREREQARAEAGTDTATAPITEEEVDENDIDVPGWEDKGRWVFYLDLVTDFTKSIVYCGFFVILLVFHGLPIHIMRDLYITVRSFCKRVLDFFQYRQATRNMNERYSDASEEDLRADNTCIICREEMTAWTVHVQGAGAGHGARPADERQRAKKLPCGHILHFSCLRSWLERQRVCPTCRRPVLNDSSSTTNTANMEDHQNRGQAENGRQPFLPRAPGVQGADANGGNAVPNQDRNIRRGANLRVFNLGPLRIALGAGPLPQAGDLLNNLARQQQEQHQNQNQNQQQQQDQAQEVENSQASSDSLNPGGLALNSSVLIHQQILQLQEQVLRLMQQLNGERLQLDVLERLVTELMRLQNQQGHASQYPDTNTAVGHYHAQSNGLPQGVSNGDMPEGLILPPGYTIQRLHPTNAPYNQRPINRAMHNLPRSPLLEETSRPSEHRQSGSASSPGEGSSRTQAPVNKTSAAVTSSSGDASSAESSSSSTRQPNALAASVEDATASSP